MRLRWGLALVALPAWAQSPAVIPAPPRDPTPRHVTLTIKSGTLGERRVINVYTPPGYDSLTGNSLPVVYMPDGGMAEDFPHIANTLDSLIARRVIAPVILVGIENIERRRDLTGPTAVATDSAIARRVGGSAEFRRFLRDELMPMIRSRYRSSEETTIVGESLAALFVVETFLLEPGLFRRYIALSPSLWWNGGALLRAAPARLRELTDLPRTLYLTAANEPGIAAETGGLAAILEVHAPAGLRWWYEPRPDLEHSTIFRLAVPAAFVKVLQPPAQGRDPGPAIEFLAGSGPAPGGEGFLLGAGVLYPVKSWLELRVLGTRVGSGASSAVQLAGVLQGAVGGRRLRPYVAGGLLWRRVAIPAGPSAQTDAGFGLLGVVGGELRLGATSRLGVFLEGHGMAAKGYGVEAAGGVRLGMGRALTSTP